MKRADWIIASSFILFGLACFIMSISFIEHSAFVHSLMISAFRYCLWIGFPLMIIGFLYLWLKNQKRKKGK